MSSHLKNKIGNKHFGTDFWDHGELLRTAFLADIPRFVLAL